ncbi:DUF4153 domain-containing protein [Candidatus Gracilibacteria bacterium]|nr:DUF4153 domain-containing protein [Candidatus Gracilibacteria bacterium]
MRNIFKSFSIDNFKESIKNIVSRFPITLVVILLTCILFFLLIHSGFTQNTENNIARAIFSLIITYFFSVGVYITSEKLDFDERKKYIYQLIPIMFGVSFFIGFDKDIGNFNNIVFFILSLTGIISYIFIAPYTQELLINLKQGVYYSYLFKISVVFLKSTILGFLLFILGNIGIRAVIELFDLSYIHMDKIIGDWAVISLCLITPIFALGQIPEKNSFNKDSFEENAFFSFLIKYVGIPFIHIYFIILYAYSIKVLFNFSDWPKGEVAWLTIGFSTFGYIIYIFSYIFEDKNKFIGYFRSFFPYAVIPQLFMLFYAIGLRIGQYDITTNRYFVVVFGLWLLIISLYFIISRNKSLSFIPALLTLFTILISVGPGSVYNLPKARQFNRLLSNLEKARIINGSQIVPLKNYEDITPELSKEIYSEIQYVCDYDNCDMIKSLFYEKYNEFAKKHKQDFEKLKNEDLLKYKNDENIVKDTNERIYNEPSRWEIVAEVTDYIKVKSYFDITEEDKIEYLNFNIDYKNNDIFPINVEGYKKLYRLGSNIEKFIEYGKIDSYKKTIEIIENGQTIEIIDINNIIEKIYSNYKDKKNLSLKKEDMTFEIQGTKGSYKIILDNLSIKNPNYKGETNRDYSYSNGYILVK